MIRFDADVLTPAEQCGQLIIRGAEVRDDGRSMIAAITRDERHVVRATVLDRHRQQGQIIRGREPLMALEDVHLLQRQAEFRRRAQIRPHRHAPAPHHGLGSSAVIAMVVRDEDPIQVRRRQVEAAESALQLAPAEAAVDQDAGRLALDEGRIAATPRPEMRDGEPHGRRTGRGPAHQASGDPAQRRPHSTDGAAPPWRGAGSPSISHSALPQAFRKPRGVRTLLHHLHDRSRRVSTASSGRSVR